ncbi:MAG TPA: hypothetical protein VNJ51_10955 [Candidatus Dormibacteraeota bacterium]|nr:hypothetical protein [Candidatus Dormibacteraeota bacterium]
MPTELQGSPKSLYLDLERSFGEVPEAFRAMERRPDLLAANWAKTKATLFSGRLPLTIKALVGVVVSAVRGSTGTLAPFLRLLLARADVEKPVLGAVMENRLDDPALSATESAILTFARASAADLRPSSEILRDAGLDDDEIFEVVATIDLATSLGAFTDGLGVEPDVTG